LLVIDRCTEERKEVNTHVLRENRRREEWSEVDKKDNKIVKKNGNIREGKFLNRYRHGKFFATSVVKYLGI
jgi:hypothetical protein